MGLFEREIVDYVLVTGEHEFMADNVPKFIKKGWQPLGGVAHVMGRYGDERFSQAMVRYKDDEPDKTIAVQP